MVVLSYDSAVTKTDCLSTAVNGVVLNGIVNLIFVFVLSKPYHSFFFQRLFSAYCLISL